MFQGQEETLTFSTCNVSGPSSTSCTGAVPTFTDLRFIIDADAGAAVFANIDFSLPQAYWVRGADIFPLGLNDCGTGGG
jgi:hypothetical protein